MKIFRKITFVLVLTLGCLTINAQQDAMYTHYMYNTLQVNPAYAGSRDALTLTALNRSQWIGFTGAPLTQTLSGHMPLKNQNIGIGLSVLNDKIGPINNSSVFADFAYIIRMTEKSKLSLGLSAGINMLHANLSSLDLDQANDVVFQNNIDNKVSPNFGFGAYYYRERFYAGISVPGLLQNSYSEVKQDNGTTLLAKEQRHYFFIAGTVFNLSDNLAFKPTTFIKLTSAAPVQADITGSFIIMNRLLVGAMFRTGDAFGVLLGLDITKQLHVGYSFDWSYGLNTAKYNHGSHELVLRYDFLLFDKKQIHTPRYF